MVYDTVVRIGRYALWKDDYEWVKKCMDYEAECVSLTWR